MDVDEPSRGTQNEEAEAPEGEPAQEEGVEEAATRARGDDTENQEMVDLGAQEAEEAEGTGNGGADDGQRADNYPGPWPIDPNSEEARSYQWNGVSFLGPLNPPDRMLTNVWALTLLVRSGFRLS